MPSPATSVTSFIPNLEASGRLRLSFARNPKKFPLSGYAKIINTGTNPRNGKKRVAGYYVKLDSSDLSRVASPEDADRTLWPDDAPRPQPVDKQGFQLEKFQCTRRDEPMSVGYRTEDQAEFSIKEIERQRAAQVCMTKRTLRCVTAITTAAAWQKKAASLETHLSVDHTSTSSTLLGGNGNLAGGSTTDPRLLNALNMIALIINKDTLGILDPGDGANPTFKLVINPNTARKLAVSAEYRDYLKNNPESYAWVTGKLHRNSLYGLPPTLYGFEILIEDTVVTTSRIGATTARGYAFPDDTIVVLARPGAMEEEFAEQAISTSSLTIFASEDLVDEEFDDERNRRWEGHIVEDVAEVLTCPASGYLLTAVFTD